MKKNSLLIRIVLFGLILSLGTIMALVLGETTGLALADLSATPVEAVVEAPEGRTLFATLEGEKKGIYRSDDYGRSWQLVGSGPEGTLSQLVVHPGNRRLLYASTEQGLWSSQDGGQSWQSYELELPQSAEINVLEMDPSNPDLLYVGTWGQGLYQVQPASERLEVLGDKSLQKLYVEDIVPDASQNQVYAITSEGLYIINGNAWHKVENLPDPAVSLAVDPSDSQTLYAGTVAYGIYRSEDGGRSWAELNDGLGWQPGVMLQIPAIAIDAQDSQHLALATAYNVGSQVVGEGIYESFNGGENWVKIGTADEVIEELIIKEGGIYAATDSGLTRYGNPIPTAPWSSSLQSRSLTSPSGLQITILVLTVLLAAGILMGRINWLPKR